MKQLKIVLCAVVVGFSHVGCVASQEEVFSEVQLALAEGNGQSCSGESAGAGEIVVSDDAAECGASRYCVSIGDESDTGIPATPGVCSCRCDGPEGSGPFCACQEGFRCQPLVDDLGLGSIGLAGSYCFAQTDSSRSNR